MPTQAAHTVTEAAAIVRVSPSQIRNWCGQFETFLSDQATPTPGQSRILTAADVATLQRVKELRDEGVDYAAIPAQLADLDPGALVPYVEPAPDSATIESPGPQAAIELFAAMESRFQAMQGQLDRLQAAQAQEEHRAQSQTVIFALGVGAGVALVGVAVLLIWLGAWMAG